MNRDPMTPRRRARRMVLAAGLRPVLAWVDWCEARLMGDGLTPAVLMRARITLDALVAQGHDPEAVLWQSVQRGADWLYPVQEGD